MGMAMHLFTSSFRWFAVGFGAMAAIGAMVPEALRRPPASDAEGEWLPTESDGIHEVFYGHSPFFESLDGAHVWIVGSSKVQYALRQADLRPFFDTHNLRYFNLGMTNLRDERFVSELVRKYSLQPPLVVVDVGGFFTGRLQVHIQAIMAERHRERKPQRLAQSHLSWADHRRAFEVSAARLVQPALQRAVPFWRFARPLEDVARPVYRSGVDGSWRFLGTVPKFGGPRLLEYDRTGRVAASNSSIQGAQAFVSLLRRRGADVIFTVIPAEGASVGRAQALAKATGVTLLIPEVEPLTGQDSVHLDRVSASKYARALLAQLEMTDEFQRCCGRGARPGAGKSGPGE